jgi:hypothetical protein
MTDCKIATRRVSVVAVCVVALAAIGFGGRVSAQGENGTWQSIGPNLPTDSESVTIDLAVDPQTPTTVYGGSRAGVYKTTDAGAHWFSVSNGLPGDGHPIVDSLVMDLQDPSTLYAGISVRPVFEPKGHGVFKTNDGGNTWTAATAGLGRYTFALAVDSQTPSTVYAIAGGARIPQRPRTERPGDGGGVQRYGVHAGASRPRSRPAAGDRQAHGMGRHRGLRRDRSPGRATVTSGGPADVRGVHRRRRSKQPGVAAGRRPRDQRQRYHLLRRRPRQR